MALEFLCNISIIFFLIIYSQLFSPRSHSLNFAFAPPYRRLLIEVIYVALIFKLLSNTVGFRFFSTTSLISFLISRELRFLFTFFIMQLVAILHMIASISSLRSGKLQPSFTCPKYFRFTPLSVINLGNILFSAPSNQLPRRQMRCFILLTF